MAAPLPGPQLLRRDAHHISLTGKQLHAFRRLFQKVGSQAYSARFKKAHHRGASKGKIPLLPPSCGGNVRNVRLLNQPHPGAPTSSMATSPHNSDRIRVKFLLLVHSHASRRRRQYGDTLASGPPSLVHGPGTPDTGK